jgi:hypothetical protein
MIGKDMHVKQGDLRGGGDPCRSQSARSSEEPPVMGGERRERRKVDA